MKDGHIAVYPPSYNALLQETMNSGFTMASDLLICSLLRTLSASKPGGKFLELGTGTGLSTSWILDGMDTTSTLVSVDNDPKFLAIAGEYLGRDPRLSLVCMDGGEWVFSNRQGKFDFVFADTWHGKYLLLDEVLAMINPGGIYVIDDMLPQPNWPEGHAEKVAALIASLETRADFSITKQSWGSGAMIAVRV